MFVCFVCQSIIEEEGGALPSTDSNDHKNWDQPLIIAEPDVQVSAAMYFISFWIMVMINNYNKNNHDYNNKK